MLDFQILCDDDGTETAEELRWHSEVRPCGWKGISQWIQKRSHVKHKTHLKKYAYKLHAETMTGFLHLTHALSLNDAFWVKKQGEAIQWECINFYANDFRDVMEFLVWKRDMAEVDWSATSPEYTSEGSYAKCWRREGDQIFLYKRGRQGEDEAGLEPYAEVLASRAAQRLCTSAVAYTIPPSERPVSRCACFTTEHTGFAPMSRFYAGGGRAEVLAYFSRLGLSEEISEMFVLDALVLNHDRHLGNFGFLVDNETQRPTGFAPIFDLNRSMMGDVVVADQQEMEEALRYLETHGAHFLGGSWTRVTRALLTPRIRAKLEQLDIPSLGEGLADAHLPEWRLRAMLESMERMRSRILTPF